ncbi:unnamed protein product [Zymoseptoria tritici ST99CH_1E4]|uniref:Alpha/beta hydrolase fold-3 domain-containing protein n=1 Tax=Zymoseptoria tritici ST99CH_1E4 TaxID=1276532 RepID=A0A2H1GZH8_ZYMTR|nr:unnamed protein product [Zymoseptoria tritici ST99CH_1E4]
MASHVQRQLSASEKFGNAFAVLKTILSALLTLPTVSSATNGANWSFKRKAIVSFLWNSTILNRREALLAAAPTTGQSIHAECKKLGLQVSSTVISCGPFPDATLHEIQLSTPSGEGNVFLYFHGGGYRNPIVGNGHVPLVLEAARAAKCEKVVFLEYTLTLRMQYPGQLVQAAYALKALMERGMKPEHIIVGGDSAGGNLVLALLAHLKKPLLEAPVVDGFGEGGKVRGVVLLSPWVSNTTHALSFTENAHKDYISSENMHIFVDLWRPRHEIYANFTNAPGSKEFWDTVPAEKMFIVAGGFEALRDDIRDVAGRLERAMGGELRFVEAEGEVHVQCVVDVASGEKPGRSHAELMKWCGEL